MKSEVLAKLRALEKPLRRRGLKSLAVFGSVASSRTQELGAEHSLAGDCRYWQFPRPACLEGEKVSLTAWHA